MIAQMHEVAILRHEGRRGFHAQYGPVDQDKGNDHVLKPGRADNLLDSIFHRRTLTDS